MAASDAAAPPSRARSAARLRDATRLRLSRLGLAGIALPVTVLVVATWSLTVALLVLVAIPGLLEPLFTWDVDPPSPRWFRILLIAGCAVVAAGALVAERLADPRGGPTRWRAVLRDTVVAAVGLGVAGLLLASDAAAPAFIAAAGAIAGVVALHLPRGAAALAITALAGALPWLAAAGAQSADPDPGLLGWLWIVLLPLAGGAAAFGALYGVARGAQSRTAGLRRVFRDDLPLPVVLALLAAALAAVALRYTALRGLFGELDGLLWTLAPSWSWVHAGLVAAATTLVVVRSARHPLARVGTRLATAVFGAAAAIQLVFLGPLVLTLAVTALLWGSGVDVSDAVLAVAPWLSVALVVALVVTVAHPAFSRSAGRWMAWVGAFYVVPGAVASAAGPAFDDVPSFWAKPPQVAALLVVAAAVVFAAGLIRPTIAVPRRIVVRLALVPVVAVHATALLPAPWETVLGRVVLVAGAVVGILFFAPRRSADPRTRGRRLLERSAAQLAGLVVFVLALPSVLSTETFGIVGTLWLAVPVAVGLCLTLVPRTDAAPAGTPAALVDSGSDER